MVNAWLDRKGYIPGEKIQFNATIDNYSGKSVRRTTVQLIQVRKITHSNWNHLHIISVTSIPHSPMENIKTK